MERYSSIAFTTLVPTSGNSGETSRSPTHRPISTPVSMSIIIIRPTSCRANYWEQRLPPLATGEVIDEVDDMKGLLKLSYPIEHGIINDWESIENIWNHISETRRAYEIYSAKEEESTGIQITFSMIFVLFSLYFCFYIYSLYLF